ncbi:MAG TPA: Lrp/AsnC family transcriptional regulator [Methanosarcinales archaeon]|nr:MAG: transcriptional regulator [Methanosarcinales archaeon]HDN65346.1 Lrp/AsnC family transcriptional regulator [Methanosarcinales archaeon]
MIDERDLLIIDILRENARTPHTEIAARLDVAESTIRNRVRALEEGEVIKQYTVVTDPSKLGYNSVALVGIDVEPTHLLDVALHLSEFPEVKFVATSAGDHMIMTEVWLTNGGALRTFIAEKIGKLAGVQSVSPTVIMDNWKVRSGNLLP